MCGQEAFNIARKADVMVRIAYLCKLKKHNFMLRPMPCECRTGSCIQAQSDNNGIESSSRS
ncbi:hypothetical protein EII14_03740 [Alloprevotella sp. OH1205_COT-284]|uniref:hypothetical protein n=1 Tax=Alloprevotella sp. OH1205_COT-284 TaxID=2491043 RepID=UPI000F5E9BDA|nr:hypothetical protein [Alloprevotella sp. OH1205_COT-284]RRD80148.1 hypothetical protein EII14_03740 [Alloprevotella sp. OH1205_COT-284]